MPIAKHVIRALLGFSRMPDASLLIRGRRVLDCMDGNLFFPRPPISLADFAAALDRFEAAMAKCLYRDTRAYAERDNERATVIIMLGQLGHYAETNCNGDMAIFLSSGFEPYPSSHVSPKPLSDARISNIKQG